MTTHEQYMDWQRVMYGLMTEEAYNERYPESRDFRGEEGS